MVALVLGLVGLIGGIALLASGEVATGIVLAVLGLVLGALAFDSARRWPTSALPRLPVRVGDAVGSRLGLAWFSTAEWAQASREVIRLRRELRALRREREAQQSALGAAAYAAVGGPADPADRRRRGSATAGRGRQDAHRTDRRSLPRKKGA